MSHPHFVVGVEEGRVEPVRDLVVLLFEGSAEWASFADERLRHELGGEVTVVHHGSLGEGKGTLLEGGFDCVLLDLMLPDCMGLETLHEVRARAPQAPIVVLSSEATEAIAVRAVHEGAQDFLVRGRTDGFHLARAIRNAVERRREELRAARWATHDELTELPNRTLFLERLSLSLGRLERRSRAAAVLFVGLDGFGAVNDRLGLHAGDALLRGVAERLRAIVRPGDTVARFGGDEFMVLCEDIASQADATTVAARICRELSRPFPVDGERVSVGASVGIAVATDRGRPAEAVLRDADRGMHGAKLRGGGFELYSAPRLQACEEPVSVA